MSLDGALEWESLLREHRALLPLLPVTFRAYLGAEIEKWPTLFAPEKAYLRVLLERLARLPGPDLAETFAGLRRVETEAGCGEVRGEPRQVQERTLALLRRKGLFVSWRGEVDRVFQHLRPQIEERLYPKGSPRRLVVVLYGQGIAIQRDQLWRRLRTIGTRVPLRLEGAEASGPFLRGLFAGLFSALGDSDSDSAGLDPGAAWIVEAGDALHALCEERAGAGFLRAVGLSYTRLRAYREELSRSLYRKVLAGVSSPQELAEYARALDILPPQGTLRAADEVVRAFVRDVFLGGNGTLLVSNTFVEWATVQALKRAEPRLLVARFGVRDKMKPFSSLLLFSSPRPTDQIPVLEDPLGSFVDVEQLSYYVWLNAEKSPAYRGKTLYLLLAEGVDEMLAIRPDAAGPGPPLPAEATLPEVAAAMARWLSEPIQSGSAKAATTSDEVSLK
jgi:hypothetical protein